MCNNYNEIPENVLPIDNKKTDGACDSKNMLIVPVQSYCPLHIMMWIICKDG